MLPKIFDVQDGKIIENDILLRIPILRNLTEKYDDALDMLSVIWFYYDIESPYISYEEETKLECIIEDLGFTDREYKLNIDFCEVLDWCKDKYESTGERFWRNHKRNIENIGIWTSTPVTGGREGDASQKISAAKEARKLYTELISFENEVKSNLKSRGQAEIAYDL